MQDHCEAHKGCDQNREVLFHNGVVGNMASILLDGDRTLDVCIEVSSVSLSISLSLKILQVLFDEQRMLDLTSFSLHSMAPS